MITIFQFPYKLISYEKYKDNNLVASGELDATLYTKDKMTSGSIQVFARLSYGCNLSIDRFCHSMVGPEDSFVVKPRLQDDSTVSFSVPSTDGGTFVLRTKSTAWIENRDCGL